MNGRMHTFQSLGTVDGPGVRSVVFLQGCPLRCPYCHNPDTQCFDGGTPVSAEALLERVLRYRPYYGKEGGVTVSGGEPLMQAEFVTAFFKLCKAKGLSTALDTSGVRSDDAVRQLLTVTDIVLLDIKFATDEKYRRYIGIPLQQVLQFLKAANAAGVRVIVRQVVTPTVNDSAADMQALQALVRQYPCVEKVELLPFLKLCTEKYEALGRPFPFSVYPQADAAAIAELQQKYFADI